jgi:putative flippase GtrA
MFFDITLLKFLAVGGINTLVGTSLMLVLFNFAGLGYWAASAVNYFLTSVLSFFLNKYFTFKIKRNTPKTALFFALNIVVCYILAYGIARPLVYRILSQHGRKLRDNAALLAGTCLFTALNYLGQRFIVFKPSPTE